MQAPRMSIRSHVVTALLTKVDYLEAEVAKMARPSFHVVQHQPPPPAVKKLTIAELAQACGLKCINGRVG